MVHLVPKVAAPVNKNYIICEICPPVPVVSTPVLVETVQKLKKLAYNHLGIPKPPDLGYVLPPVPSMEEM